MSHRSKAQCHQYEHASSMSDFFCRLANGTDLLVPTYMPNLCELDTCACIGWVALSTSVQLGADSARDRAARAATIDNPARRVYIRKDGGHLRAISMMRRAWEARCALVTRSRRPPRSQSTPPQSPTCLARSKTPSDGMSVRPLRLEDAGVRAPTRTRQS